IGEVNIICSDGFSPFINVRVAYSFVKVTIGHSLASLSNPAACGRKTAHSKYLKLANLFSPLFFIFKLLSLTLTSFHLM
ncbi:hypothetical protein PSM30_18625, partial [Clostridioides difficile]|uniref:hypothetical protein n=1 Tax=Clostridioides difficile TaxID=1496 RepID=UPI002359FF7B